MASFSKTNAAVKLLIPAILGVSLVGCGFGAPVSTPPPAAPSANNPLAPLSGLAPNSEVGDALQGLGALSQLGTAFDQKGNVTDPNAMQNFLNSMQQIDAQQKAREFQAAESVDFPSNAPPVLKSFAYANGKLTSVNDSSNSPNYDFNLKYQTMDAMKTVGDFYKNLAKTATGGWKITGQTTSASEGTITLQNQASNGEENLTVRWSADAGITSIQIRFWTYYN